MSKVITRKMLDEYMCDPRYWRDKEPAYCKEINEIALAVYERTMSENVPYDMSDCIELDEEGSIQASWFKKGTFEWALQQMREGKKVRRSSWWGEVYCRIKCDKIVFDGAVALTSLAGIDILATDWELYEEPKKTMKFRDWVDVKDGTYAICANNKLYINEGVVEFFNKSKDHWYDASDYDLLRWMMDNPEVEIVE